MKFTSALSTLLVLLPAVTVAIAIPAPPDVLARDGLVARQNGQNRGQNRNGQNQGQNRNGQNPGQNRNGGNNNANAGNNNANAGNNNANAGNNNANAGNNNANAGNNNANAGNNNANAGNNNANAGNNNANAGNNNANAGNNNAGNNNNNNNAGNNNQDPQESLTLLQELVAPGLAQDGQDPPVAGQVASLTSTNNFINFCAGQTITNGLQVKEGSCNPVPMGDIVAQANMPSSKFTNPKNFDTIPANQAFVASIAVDNMQTGFFTNAQKNYYAAPQQVNQQGILIAHSHIVIQQMQDFDNPQPLDPLDFAFFKGLNEPANNGVLSADVTDGLAAGKYRMASIHASANHAPAIVAVAQHGFLDDIVYFTVE